MLGIVAYIDRAVTAKHSKDVASKADEEGETLGRPCTAVCELSEDVMS